LLAAQLLDLPPALAFSAVDPPLSRKAVARNEAEIVAQNSGRMAA